MLDCHNHIEENENFQSREIVKNAVMFAVLGVLRKQALFIISVDNFIFEDNKIILLSNKNPIIYHEYPRHSRV